MLFKLSFITICLFDLHQCRQGESIGLGYTKAPAIYILKSEVSACGVRH